MFCPVCGDEYRTGFSRCADCDVDLVDTPPPSEDEAEAEPELVTVLETGDQDLVTVARSVLQAAGIPCIAQNERLSFGWGITGSRFASARGPVRLQVARKHEAIARELLSDAPATDDEKGRA